MCKRTGYLYEQIFDWDNLLLADKNARRGKKRFSYGVRHHDNNRIDNLKSLQKQLMDDSFKTSEYKVMTIKADRGKIREIWKLPYFPDRILHHAIMQVIEPYLTRHFINDTYACVRGKGLNYGVERVKKALLDKDAKWCLKTDIRKFYPSIDQDVTMLYLSKIFKDKRLLNLLNEIVHSTPSGLPIGLYTSQPIANFVLSPLDHYIKEVLKVKYYFRYCDDMVFIGKTKEEMKTVFDAVTNITKNELHLEIKPNAAIFPIGYEIKNEKNKRKRRRSNKRKVDRLSGISVYSGKNNAA